MAINTNYIGHTLESAMCYVENTSIQESRMIRVGLIKVKPEKRLERDEELSHAVIWRKYVAGRKGHPVQRP